VSRRDRRILLVLRRGDDATVVGRNRCQHVRGCLPLLFANSTAQQDEVISWEIWPLFSGREDLGPTAPPSDPVAFLTKSPERQNRFPRRSPKLVRLTPKHTPTLPPVTELAHGHVAHRRLLGVVLLRGVEGDGLGGPAVGVLGDAPPRALDREVSEIAGTSTAELPTPSTR
jgi:hypothetical protein